MSTLLVLGLANWIATTIVCESKLVEPLREWVAMHVDAADLWCVDETLSEDNRPYCKAYDRWVWARYLIGCPLCVGTWIAVAEGTLATLWVDGWLLFPVYVLAVKAIGHLVLELRPQAWLEKP